MDKNRALSFISAYCARVNPQIIMRFDCRQINDVCNIRVGSSRQTHWMISACNDGYIKVFAPFKDHGLVRAIKSSCGNPICLDASGANHPRTLGDSKDLLAVGFDDDSFVVYSILRNFVPLFRGLGHRASVCQIKFDNYYADSQQKYFTQSNRCALEFQPSEKHFSGKPKTILDAIKQRSREIQMSKKSNEEREYRIVTGGEDGTVCWWNIVDS